jgi:regulator of protease activity HflC (stomatin/prohibitin superfamily)
VQIDQSVAEHIERRVQGFGLEVDSVGVKDIILPGEMKVILAKVVEAEKGGARERDSAAARKPRRPARC